MLNNILYNKNVYNVKHKIKKGGKIFMSMQSMVAVRLDTETKNKIEQVAKQKRRKTSDLLRIIIEDYVKQFEDVMEIK